MSDGARNVLDAFESLPANEREEVLAELIRRAADRDHDSPTDAELVAAADRLFVEYERSESES
jgi:hypothetical protein